MKRSDDWRHNVISNLSEDWTSPWSGQHVPKGSQITVVTIAKTKQGKHLTLPLPNATALMINASQRAYRAASKLRLKHKIDTSKSAEVAFRHSGEAFEFIEHLMEAVLTAHAGLEAFVNDQIPDDYEHVSNRRSDVVVEVSNKQKIQRYFSLSEKISEVLPEILGVASPKGASPSWAEFKKLKKLRDRITHMKSEDRRSAQADVDTVWHSLVIAEPPHSQALAVIRYFEPKLRQHPRWLAQCPIT